MKPENTKRLDQIIRSFAIEIQPLLPPDPRHPQGRIAYAHLYKVVKDVLGKPVHECRDERYSDIVEIILYCRDNVKELHLATALRAKYQAEPQDNKQANLNEFLR